MYELLFEYHDKESRKQVSIEALEEEADKIEEAQIEETMDWIEEEERKEREEAEARKKEEEWMLEQLKKEHGDDFGEDLNLDFSE